MLSAVGDTSYLWAANRAFAEGVRNDIRRVLMEHAANTGPIQAK